MQCANIAEAMGHGKKGKQMPRKLSAATMEKLKAYQEAWSQAYDAIYDDLVEDTSNETGLDYNAMRIAGEIAKCPNIFPSEDQAADTSKIDLKNEPATVEPVEIIITVDGGVIQDIEGIPAGIVLVVRDYDTDGSDEDRLTKCPKGAYGSYCYESRWMNEC